MGGIMISIIKVGTVSFICGKALKCFGKQDYADIIYMCGWLGVGANICILFMQMYASVMGSEIVQLIQKIFS